MPGLAGQPQKGAKDRFIRPLSDQALADMRINPETSWRPVE